MNNSSPALTRRGVLTAGGAALIGAAGGFALGRSTDPALIDTRSAPSPTRPATTTIVAPGPDRVVPFHGAHQAGVETAPAALQTFIGLDLTDPSPESGLAVLRLVTDDAARLTQGIAALGDTEPELATVPASLTVTLGLGRSFFTRTGADTQIPRELVELPAFPTDALDRRWGQTDLLLQVGADDAITLTHAIRMITKDLSTLATVAWMQAGFRSSAPAVPGGTTTRNLMGQVDGTVNPAAGTPTFDEVVWIAEEPGRPDWVTGGTVLVLRRIRMLLDTWEVLDRQTQERVIGRRIDTGAPLGRTHENDVVPLDETDEHGLPLIPADAHVRVAHASRVEEMILRRPYSYDNGIEGGRHDVGLLFAAYMRDPATSFIPMQERIAALDAFNAWNITIGSGSYFIPSGITDGRVLAEGIFT